MLETYGGVTLGGAMQAEEGAAGLTLPSQEEAGSAEQPAAVDRHSLPGKLGHPSVKAA